MLIEILKIALNCVVCNHVWDFELENATSSMMQDACVEHGKCPECGVAGVGYVGEAVTHVTKYVRYPKGAKGLPTTE